MSSSTGSSARDAVGLGHRDAPGPLRLARTRSAVTISGASIVTSPAPMVTTTSPGSAAAATASATAERSGRYCTRHTDVFGDTCPTHPGDGLFAGAVDVEHEHPVGAVQRGSEFGGESLCPRIQVRLKDHQRTAGAALVQERPDRLQRGPDLRRMVRVIIDNPYRSRGSDQVEAAAHALETGQPVQHAFGRGADFDGGQQRAQRVERHMPARHRQAHHPRMDFAAEPDVRDRLGALLFPRQQRPCQRVVGVRRRAIPQHPDT